MLQILKEREQEVTYDKERMCEEEEEEEKEEEEEEEDSKD